MATIEAAVPGEGRGVSTYAGGVWSWITTVDHKRIGILYFVSGLVFFLVGGVEAMLIRLHQCALGTPASHHPC